MLSFVGVGYNRVFLCTLFSVCMRLMISGVGLWCLRCFLVRILCLMVGGRLWGGISGGEGCWGWSFFLNKQWVNPVPHILEKVPRFC